MQTINTTYVEEIDRQVVLTTSALRNVRAILVKNSKSLIPPKPEKWPKHMRQECDLLRSRVDDLMGTITLLLSVCSRSTDHIDGINISSDDANLALASCENAISDGELSMEMLDEYTKYISTFVTDLIHGTNSVTSIRAAEYYKRSLELSSMLVSL